MSLICAISGSVPEEPVVSPASGRVFERRLILTHVRASGTDPISGTPLTEDDLIPITGTTPSRVRTGNSLSVPALLQLLQDEWDACALETFTLRSHVDAVRQELAHALYQHDAACRVIARLTKERDQARAALAALQPGVQHTAVQQSNGVAQPSGPVTMEGVSAGGVSGEAEYVANIDATARTLSEGRKKRSKPEGLSSVEELRGMGVRSSHAALGGSSAHVSCMDVRGDGTALSGTADGKVIVFNSKTSSTVATFSGHEGAVNRAVFHPTEDLVLSAGSDNTIRVWRSSSGEQVNTIKVHTQGVEDLAIHPTGKYVVSCSRDNTWAVSDIHNGRVLFSVTEDASMQGLVRVGVHPDGLIAAVGTVSGAVRIWDLKSRAVLATFAGTHTAPVSALAFSSNGYLFASGAQDARVALWDLRSQKCVKSVDYEQGSNVATLDFDDSGTYLAAAAADKIRLYLGKKLESVTELSVSGSGAAGARWGPLAKSLIAVTADNALALIE